LAVNDVLFMAALSAIEQESLLQSRISSFSSKRGLKLSLAAETLSSRKGCKIETPYTIVTRPLIVTKSVKFASGKLSFAIY